MNNDEKLERGVISSLISDNGLLLEFFMDINPNLFHSAKNNVVVNKIIELQNKGIVSDYDSLDNILTKHEYKIDVYDYCEPLNRYNFSE